MPCKRYKLVNRHFMVNVYTIPRFIRPAMDIPAERFVQSGTDNGYLPQMGITTSLVRRLAEFMRRIYFQVHGFINFAGGFRYSRFYPWVLSLVKDRLQRKIHNSLILSIYIYIYWIDFSCSSIKPFCIKRNTLLTTQARSIAITLLSPGALGKY